MYIVVKYISILILVIISFRCVCIPFVTLLCISCLFFTLACFEGYDLSFCIHVHVHVKYHVSYVLENYNDEYMEFVQHLPLCGITMCHRYVHVRVNIICVATL